MEALKLHEVRHPQKDCRQRYESLFGLDAQKASLLENLKIVFDANGLEAWQKKHHPKGLNFIGSALRVTPLILLSGDVGCGKTELASCIATPLSDALNEQTIRVFETPSDTRGSGKVGELSARITAAFRSAAIHLKSHEKGILIIDEADDLATGRDQQQAHHEDRAGVNALIKEIDRIQKDKVPLAVLLITNRTGVIDPAVRRRAVVDIRFDRPDSATVRQIIKHFLENVESTDAQVNELVDLCMKRQPLYSFSDFFTRIARQSVILALQRNEPFSASILREVIQVTKPSPNIEQP